MTQTQFPRDTHPAPLCHPADYHGECDECHQPHPLWIDFHKADTPGYCVKCWGRLLKKERAV